jgi:hypothetical protein
MNSDIDQTVYMLGMLSGLQAMTNDINSGGAVNVPKDIAAIVERGMVCLNNEKFWGAPNATRAVIWTLLPGAGDGKPDPYQTLKQSTQIGEQKGVRLSHALYALLHKPVAMMRKSVMPYVPLHKRVAMKNLLIHNLSSSIVWLKAW